MKLNYNKLHEFLKVDDYRDYNLKNIPLTRLYDKPSELTINELVDLLDYIYTYTAEQTDYSETAIYNINIKYTPDDGGHEVYLLEMKWPTIYDQRSINQ